MRTLYAALLVGGCALSMPGPALSQDWPNWRGPQFNGSTEAKNLPVEFSREKKVVWSTPLPGTSAATPVVRGSRVYTTSADFARQKLIVHCLDRSSGKILWQDEMGTGYRSGNEGSAVRLDERSHYAAPSPTTDGKRVVFFFGNGDLAAYTHAGKKLWQRNLQKDYGDFAFQWTFSSSPQLWNNRLYLQILQRDRPVGARGKDDARSFLLSLDPETGKEQWRTERPSVAKNESRESYATPIPVEVSGKKQLLLAGGDVVTGHDPENGRELWRWG
ncbi:MAG: PQQ-binding-like beta-propeller repeat protein, partial [Armatimonadaceae bacterium]